MFSSFLTLTSAQIVNTDLGNNSQVTKKCQDTANATIITAKKKVLSLWFLQRLLLIILLSS